MLPLKRDYKWNPWTNFKTSILSVIIRERDTEPGGPWKLRVSTDVIRISFRSQCQLQKDCPWPGISPKNDYSETRIFGTERRKRTDRLEPLSSKGTQQYTIPRFFSTTKTDKSNNEQSCFTSEGLKNIHLDPQILLLKYIKRYLFYLSIKSQKR